MMDPPPAVRVMNLPDDNANAMKSAREMRLTTRRRSRWTTASVTSPLLLLLLALLSSSVRFSLCHGAKPATAPFHHSKTILMSKQQPQLDNNDDDGDQVAITSPLLLPTPKVSTSAFFSPWTLTRSLELSRGGAGASRRSQRDDDDDETHDDDEEDDDEEEEMALTSDDNDGAMDQILSTGWAALKATCKMVQKGMSVTARAISRSVNAGLFEEEEDDRDLPTLTRVGKALGRMLSALWGGAGNEGEEKEKEEEATSTEAPKPKKKAKAKTSTANKSAPKPSSKTTTSTSDSVIATKKKKKKKTKKTTTTEAAADAKPKTPKHRDEDESPEPKKESPAPAKQSAPTVPKTPILSSVSKGPADYGIYLEKAYKVDGSRDSLEEPCIVHTGSFSDALVAARSEARLLLVLIPSQKPPSNNEADQKALKAFLSEDVSNMANRAARKNGAVNTGSFFLWSALPGSPEAALAMRRLKVSATNAKNKKRPILAVAYVGHAVDSYGRPQYGAKLLAQHHASPPPTSDMMAAWMNALRKRHAAQYVKMQKDLAEAQYFKERREGYHSSMRTDTENRQKEAQQAKEEAARKAVEEERQAQIVERRAQLEQDLPEEPAASLKDAKTIALRLADGQTLRRRFAADTGLETVFNWVDVTQEQEREAVMLTSLNGKFQFTWSSSSRESTLEELGLDKMTAFRVSRAEEQSDSQNEEKDDDDDDDDDDNDEE